MRTIRGRPISFASLDPCWQLAATGLGLAALTALAFIVASYLDWYPARLGPVAYWIEDRAFGLLGLVFNGPNGRNEFAIGATFFTILAASFAVYVVAIRLALRLGRGDLRCLAAVVVASALCSLVLIPQPYISSQDIFSYAFYGRILSVYGQNPYVDVPRDFPFEPLFGVIFWKDQTSNYGPLWTYVSGLVALVTWPNVALTLIAHKALVVTFGLLGVPLVWAILGRVAPEEQLAGTVVYAWNPLLLFEASGNGHNDTMMTLFLLLGICLFVRGHPYWGLTAMMASALTKYVSIIVLPFFVMLLLVEARGLVRRVGIVVRVGLVSALLSVAVFLPVYQGPSIFQVIFFGSNALAYTNSPLELAFRELREAMGEPHDLASLPLRYRGWWVQTKVPTVLWSEVDDPRAQGVSLPLNAPMLVVEPQRQRWLHVYEPRLDRFGYVPASDVVAALPPSNVGAAGTTAAILEDAGRSEIARRANLILRAITTTIFAVVYFFLLIRTRRFSQAVWSSLLALFLSYWLIEAWFWSWYLIWVVAFAALLPRSRLSTLVLLFCQWTLMLNAQTTLDAFPGVSFMYEYRSLMLFGFPAICFVLWLVWRRAPVVRARRAILGTLDRIRHFLAPRWVAIGLAVEVLALLLVSAFVAPAQSQPHPSAANNDPASTYRAWEFEYQSGLERLSSEQYAQAAAAFTRAASFRPDILDTYRGRFIAYLQTGKYDAAIADLTRLLDAQGEQPGLLLARGDAYERKQRLDLALRDFTRAMALDSSDPQPRRRRALIYFQLGHLDEALVEARAAIDLNPNYAPLYRELADIYAARRDYSEALRMYDQALAIDPSYVQAYAGRAAAYRILGRPDQTVPDLERVLVLSNDVDEKLWARRTISSVAGQMQSGTSTPPASP